MNDFFKENNAEANSYDKNILEKAKLIEELDEPQKKSLLTFIDTAIADKRLRDTLNNALSVAS